MHYCLLVPFTTTGVKKIIGVEITGSGNFQGYLKHSVLFYGHYGSGAAFSHVAPSYFLTGVAIFVISYVIILRRYVLATGHGCTHL